MWELANYCLNVPRDVLKIPKTQNNRSLIVRPATHRSRILGVCERISILKVDVEGAEAVIFSGTMAAA